MNLRIELTRNDYLLLLGKIPADSSSRHIFESQKKADGIGMVEFQYDQGMPMGDEVVIYCSREDAEQLLAIALQHSTDAAYPIRRALAGLP
jgi:hypothetical protein